MPDKELTCLECGNGFMFTEEEQETFSKKGYRHDPKRCPDCRDWRRNAMRGDIKRSPRGLHTITCSKCGQESQVPFKPRTDRPVFCDACYRDSKPD